MQQEEEEMTTYDPQDLSDGWEFKMLRSMRSAFRDPEKLKQILAEERRAGWVLVEKFDDGRIRLKRAAKAQEADRQLDFDPYRTYVGPSESKYVLAVMGITFGAIAAVILFIVIISKFR
jgi:hypothetical protein